jgi:hypothetical protein
VSVTTAHNQPTTRQRTIIDIPPSAMARLTAVMPAFEQLAEPGNTARAGIVRHGGVSKAVNHVPAAYKHPYGAHLSECRRAQPSSDAAFIIIGSRNSFQNLLLPIWLRGQLICRHDEPWAGTIYTALCVLASGERVIQRVRFISTNGTIDIEGESAQRIATAVVGQPLVFKGSRPSLSTLAAMTYDQRHVLHLMWEDWQVDAFPAFAWHREAHDELMRAFMATLDSGIEQRAALLADIAARRLLQQEAGYLHSSIGLRPDGSVVLLMMTGSLEDHGRAHLDMGVESAILLDNGGSVGAAYWSAADARAGKQPHMIGAGSYFRDQALTTLVFELTENILEEPFAPMRDGNAAAAPWRRW